MDFTSPRMSAFTGPAGVLVARGFIIGLCAMFRLGRNNWSSIDDVDASFSHKDALFLYLAICIATQNLPPTNLLRGGGRAQWWWRLGHSHPIQGESIPYTKDRKIVSGLSPQRSSETNVPAATRSAK